MRLPNGYGTVKKMSGKRRKPYIIQVTTGWEIVEGKKAKQKRATLGYAATRAEGLQVLAEYRKNPYDIEASKKLFRKFSTNGQRQNFLPFPNRT